MITVRDARPEDAEEILKIYSYYIINTAITFECTVPDRETFRRRMEKTLENYPYLVAEVDGKIKGYAYAGPFVGREAYSHSCTLSIYTDKSAHRCGLGRALYSEIEKRLKEKGFLNLYACIASPHEPDEYLTNDSENFHSHMGFVRVGTFHNCGCKFGRWYNMVWMEKIIGEHK